MRFCEPVIGRIRTDAENRARVREKAQPREHARVAATVASTRRQIGSELGAAVFGALVSSGLTGSVQVSLTDASLPGGGVTDAWMRRSVTDAGLGHPWCTGPT